MGISLVIKGFFILFLGIGLFSFGEMAYLTLFSWDKDKLEFYKLAPATAILLSAIIAAFTIIRNALYAEEQKKRREEEEKKGNNKIIQVYLELIKNEVTSQIQRYRSKTLSLESSSTRDIAYSQFKDRLINLSDKNSVLINHFDYITNYSLHKYTDKSMLEYIVNSKSIVLEVIMIKDIIQSNSIVKEEDLNLEKEMNSIENLMNKCIEQLKSAETILKNIKF